MPPHHLPYLPLALTLTGRAVAPPVGAAAAYVATRLPVTAYGLRMPSHPRADFLCAVH